MKKAYALKGMMCTACAANIDHAVRKIDGIIDVNVSFVKNEMIVESNIDLTEAIIQVVKKAGYKAIPIEELINEDKKKDRSLLKLIISYILLIILMYFSMGHMLSLPIPEVFHNPLYLSILELVLTIPIVIIHFNYVIGGVIHLTKFNPDMNSLVAIGVISSLTLGVITIIRQIISPVDDVHLYFESAAMIVTFVSTGKYIERRSKDKTKASIEELEKLKPKEANVIINGVEMTMNTKDIELGSTIIIRPGEVAPLDGIVTQGTTSMDESSITGESIGVYKEVGSKVVSSAINIDGVIKVETTSTDKDSTIRRIIELVNEASSSKAKVSRLVDTISRFFTPFVILISIITLVVHLLLKVDAFSSINQAITVLVVSCPCALGLATPIAVLVGTGVAARNGLILNSVSTLENLYNVKNVVFDKTGTLTKGELEVIEYIEFNNKIDSKSIIYSLENNSNHPISIAIIKYLNGTKLLEVSSFENVSGKGVKGIIDNTKYYIGSLAYLNELNIKIDDDNLNQVNELLDKGYTPMFLFNSTTLYSCVFLRDIVRRESKELIDYLNKNKYNVYLLSGDNSRVATQVGKELGIDNVYSEVLPSDKQSIINELKLKGKTLMVGDGINDAPSLEEADVGLSLGSSTDVAKVTADIILLHNNIYDTVNAIRLSKRVITTIIINLSWAFFYNLVAITLASGALSPLGLNINPMIASLMMSISSVFVVLNSLTINLFKRKDALNKEESSYETVEFKVKGMSCEHCVKRVSDALYKGTNVKGVEVSLKLNKATVTGSALDIEELEKLVKDAGYLLNKNKK